MSDYDMPSQLAELENSENFDELLDLDLFGEDNFGAELGQNQVLDLPSESTSQQDVGSQEIFEANEQPQERNSSGDDQLSFGFDDFLQNQDPSLGLEDGIPADETLIGGQAQVGLASGNASSQLDFLELDAGGPLNLDQLPEGVTNNEEAPEFDFDVFVSPEWQQYMNNADDRDIDDIIGTGMQERHQPADQRQGSHIDRPTAAILRDSAHSLTPAASFQASNGFAHPGPSDMQRASSTTNPTELSRPNNSHEAGDDGNSDESDQESEESDTPYYETYDQDDPLIIPDVAQPGRGQTGRRNGQEVWFNPETKEWQPSASHHDMRATLIARAQAEYPGDRYLHPDPTDGLPHGETAFFKPHQNRGPERHQCADELFVWREYHPKKDENGKPLKRAEPRNRARDHPGFMFEEDKILLDPHNNPVVDHKFIPLTLSVYTDGGKLQEMALKPGCRQIDLWARMPRWEQKTDKSGRSVTIPLRGKNTRINMPMTRFREKKGTIAGGDREGTDVIMDGLRRFYHHHGFDPVASGNSVKAFPRDLLPWEVKEVRLGNTARFGGRAGNRALDDDKRQSNLRKTLKAIENGKKRQAANDGDGAGKRRREEDDTGSEDSSAEPQKRRRRGQEMNTHHQQGRHPQPSGPSLMEFNTNGEARASYQSQPPPIQYASHLNQTFPSIGAIPTASPNWTQQAANGGVQMQGTRNPYENADLGVPLNNSTLNSRYHPGYNHPQVNAGIQRTPTSQPAVPHSAPRLARNTLGPGGRRTEQAPQQVLGKHGRQDAQGLEGAEDRGNRSGTSAELGVSVAPSSNYGRRGSVVPNANGQQHLNMQAPSVADSDSAHKRRRQNPVPEVETRPQRRRQRERNPRPSHYSAMGAPTPLVPPDEFFGSMQPTADGNEVADARLMSPGELSRELGDVFADQNQIISANGGVNQGASGAWERQLDLQRTSGVHEPRQVLGKHRRKDPRGQWDEDLYQTQRNLGQQGPEEHFNAPEQETYAPGSKRRRMPGNAGNNAPPVQTPKTQAVKKARRAERDAQLPPLGLHVANTVPNLHLHQAPQMAGADRTTPQHIYTNRTHIDDINVPSQAAHPQGPYLPPAYLRRQGSVDMRDVRPSNGRQSQSLENALRYTREAYREWTGEEAPVTNLEDSYNVQYREIRAAFRAWWWSEANHQHLDPLPELWRTRRWTGTFDDWDAPENKEHLRESVKRGKQAG